MDEKLKKKIDRLLLNTIVKASETSRSYDKQWDVVDTFFNTNEPEGFGSVVTPDEARALKTYYFVNAEEYDVHEYRKQLTASNPELVKKAEAAARKIARADGLSDEEIEEMFQ